MRQLRQLRRVAADPIAVAALAGIALLAAALAAAPIDGRAAADPPLIVADLRGDALVIVDPHDSGSARRIELPGGPHELVHLPDGRVAVTLEQSGRVALVDVTTGEVEVREIGGLPHGMDERGGVLYVTDRAVDAVRRFSLAGWVELQPLAAGEWPHAVRVLPDGRIVTANAADSTLRIGDIAVAASELAETVAVRPGGNRVATAGAHGGAVEVFTLDGVAVERYQVGGRPVRVAYGPDGTLAAALSASGAVALIDAGEVLIAHVGGVPDGLAFSPDGARVYVGDVRGGVVSVVNVTSGDVLARIRAGESAGALLFAR